MDRPSWIIRPMRHADIDKCLVIWSHVELTEAKQTVASVLSADPDGFYVAELRDTGEVIGMCAGPMTRPDTAFMGFYAVDPRYQKVGIGRDLWSKTLSRLDESVVNVGLYGVPAMSEKYKKSGFTIEDSTRMLVFESRANAELKLNINELKDIDELAGCKLVPIGPSSSESLFKKLVDYDQSVQKFCREKLLRIYLTGDDCPLTFAVVRDHSSEQSKPCAHPACDQHHQQSDYSGERKSSCCVKPSQEAIQEDETLSTTRHQASNLASVSSNSLGDLSSVRCSAPSADSFQVKCSLDDNNESSCYEILGYGIIRVDNNEGGIIGPIYADSSDICEVLLRNLMINFKLEEGHIFSAMALTSNKQACRLLTKVGLAEIEQCSRMFTKYVPAASFSKIYYVHSPNFTLF